MNSRNEIDFDKDNKIAEDNRRDYSAEMIGKITSDSIIDSRNELSNKFNRSKEVIVENT